jgi:membrane-bound inhibitor of C-type lysozyme
MRTWRRLTYACEGDTRVVVNLHGTMAKVVYKGHTYNMKQAEGSDGHKYTDGSRAWMEKEEVGSLERISKSGDGKALAAGCHLQTAGTNPPNPGQSGKTPNQK